MYYVYILQSIKDRKIYTGFSSDLRQRLQTHNQGKVASTKKRRPFKLVYYEAYLSKQDAMQREFDLKHQTEQRNFLKNQIKNSLSSLPPS
ncbi:MAG: hypothetical protein A2295_04610 [Candidatus Jacksonbacteria bacterium RIFOXYB2_FULL_44_15]|nr:MAG: hypothetical protein A2240_05060 [Candidatus Jacksonbacteria bacterium RIFOXYA2_FULL_43_12]OGY77920.1 MAG: hypothetical protein A2295_04610 [Candidatus Jacksonbacteria bacterium RIFOXYB2_FULL_44_15]